MRADRKPGREANSLSVGLEGDLASVPAQPIPQLLGQGVLWLPFTHRAGVTPVNDGTAAG